MEKKIKTPAIDRKQAVRLFKDNNAVLILVLLLVIAFVGVDGFQNGFHNVIKYTAMYTPVCLGLSLVMITGNIDLSAGFQAGLAGVTSVITFNLVYGVTENSTLALVVAVLGALVTGVLTGIINGFFIAKVGINSMIATIAANYAYQGIVFFFAQSSFEPADTDIVKLFAQTRLGGLKWLTPSVITCAVVLIVVFLWMYKSRFGNRLYVVGDNAEAAAYAGISVTRTVWTSYVLCGLLAALSGFAMVSNAGFAIYTQGSSLATLTISCCVVGGIKMAGGKGTAVHVLLGVLVMRTISQMMTSLYLTSQLVNLITGLLLILVLVIDRFTGSKDAGD